MKSRSPWQASAITACVAASVHGASASVSAVTILRGRFRLSSLRLRHNYFAWPLPPLSSPNLKLTIPYTLTKPFFAFHFTNYQDHVDPPTRSVQQSKLLPV